MSAKCYKASPWKILRQLTVCRLRKKNWRRSHANSLSISCRRSYSQNHNQSMTYWHVGFHSTWSSKTSSRTSSTWMESSSPSHSQNQKYLKTQTFLLQISVNLLSWSTCVFISTIRWRWTSASTQLTYMSNRHTWVRKSLIPSSNSKTLQSACS